jgi:hypothetical protein
MVVETTSLIILLIVKGLDAGRTEARIEVHETTMRTAHQAVGIASQYPGPSKQKLFVAGPTAVACYLDYKAR